MKILYFDCFSGISGDMTIGALLDLGIDREAFLKEISKLGLEGYKIEITNKTANGIMGTDVNVVLTDSNCSEEHHEHHHNHEHEHEHEHEHQHEHDHEHEHEHLHEHEHHHNHEHEHHEHQHEHPQNHNHAHDHSHAHEERGLTEIECILDQSSLSENVKAFSKKVFREIAAAEAKVHGKPIDEVHFHEVGAIDSIVDIAGVAICLELLGVERVYSSAIHDGSGFIQCQHGIIPVPVPAVMEMLSGSGIPLVTEDVSTELVTPTGMGLIKCMSAGFGKMPHMTVEKVGYGLGKRNIGRLNALRVILGETVETSPQQKGKGKYEGRYDGKCMNHYTECSDEIAEDVIAVLETNIDDTTAEILGYTMSRLLEAGALDAYYTPVFMKKNRPAYMLTVLSALNTKDCMADIILRETSTLGIRTRYIERYCMAREIVIVKTNYGDAKAKIASLGDIKKASPEYEDCRRIAERNHLPLARVYAMVAAEAAKQYDL